MFFRRNKAKVINLCLMFFSILLPLFLADIVLKNMRLPKDSNRLMLLGGSSLYSSKDGFRRYEANQNIEQLAIYNDQIAYRYFYKTNNLGLVSYPNLKDNDNLDVVINGDSFTEGQGGFPWIVDWQKKELQESNILSLNYAIAGNGFGDFLKASLHARKIYNAKKNIIFLIEHDAYRPYQKLSKNKNCSFYSNGTLDKILGPLTCKTYGIVWHHINLSKTNKQILNQSKYLQNYGVLPTFYKFIQKLRNNYLKKDIQSSQINMGLDNGEIKLRYGPLPTKTKSAIKKINNIYGKNNVLYVYLPSSQGEQDEKSKLFTKILSEVDNNNIVDLWEICPLSFTDFHILDNHPNIDGYKKIKKCVIENLQINEFIKN